MVKGIGLGKDECKNTAAAYDPQTTTYPHYNAYITDKSFVSDSISSTPDKDIAMHYKYILDIYRTVGPTVINQTFNDFTILLREFLSAKIDELDAEGKQIYIAQESYTYMRNSINEFILPKAISTMRLIKLTTIVRSDLDPAYKIPQSIHSVTEFINKYPYEYKDWNLNSNYLCCLEASLDVIREFIDLLELLSIKYSIFLEPDIGNEITSITIEPLDSKLHKKLFKHLNLANHEYRYS